MSVLIKGMTTPKNCKECKFSWWDVGHWYCEADGEPWGLEVTGWYADGRHPDCPLVEVPEDVQPVKHGRWIPLTQNVEPTALKCSLCGEISCCYGMYCPDCGARMDGGI